MVPNVLERSSILVYFLFDTGYAKASFLDLTRMQWAVSRSTLEFRTCKNYWSNDICICSFTKFQHKRNSQMSSLAHLGITIINFVNFQRMSYFCIFFQLAICILIKVFKRNTSTLIKSPKI